MTRPVRAAGRVGRRLVPWRGENDDADETTQDRFDSWLEHFYGDRLAAIDAACEQGPQLDQYALFRDLDDDLWALLLTQQYDAYPGIRAFLPTVPPADLQELWNGRSGIPLAMLSKGFYRKLRACYERHSGRPIATARVLDFGCGWGRLTRYLARDVAPGALYGCDPVEGILDVCRADRVPALLARSDFLPDRLPFEDRFDLVFAFSVFTHLSEPAHKQCMLALHQALQPGGILIMTLRPPAYLHESDLMRPVLNALGTDGQTWLASPRYLFVPLPAVPENPQTHGDGQIDYGETVLTMPYLRERWSSRFDLLEVNVPLDDPYQVMVAMRRL